MKKFTAIFSLVIFLVISVSSQTRLQILETLLPLELLKEIINESSGDLALQNEIFLTAVNRNRLPEEYVKGYFETDFILKKLKEYGIEDASVIEFSGSFSGANETWDAEMAELWTVEPAKRKIADLNEIATSLCSGSFSCDVTAELAYVGPGNRESFYEGKEIEGKIVLVNGRPESARRLAVEKFGALGLIGYSSSHPEYDRDQVGWNSIRPSENEKKTFAFMISTRQGQDLRDVLESGTKIIIRALCKTQMIPYKNEMVSALLKGSEYPDEELVFTAHLFEGFAKQGANDDASGCVAILEVARVIKKLMVSGKVPSLKRSIRFLFIPEISGSAAFIRQHPEIAQRFFANINEDMVGEALIKNNAHFCLKQTPWSIPSYLNDVLAALYEWVGQTNRVTIESRDMILPIVSPTGTRDPFYYAIDPYYGASDHVVFIEGGVKVPAVMMIAWPDMWYHTSGDLPDKSDSTQLKRVVVISAAAALFLANADKNEVEKMIVETSGRGMSRLSLDRLSAEKLILKAPEKDIHTLFKEARNFVSQAFAREKEALSSVEFFIKGHTSLENFLNVKMKGLEDLEKHYLEELDGVYKLKCQKENIKPQKVRLSKDETRLSKLVPVRTEKMKGRFDSRSFREEIRKLKDLPRYSLGRTEFEARNFIDGKKSILDIRNAVSAELNPVSLQDVENFMKVLEKTGFIQIHQK